MAGPGAKKATTKKDLDDLLADLDQEQKQDKVETEQRVQNIRSKRLL